MPDFHYCDFECKVLKLWFKNDSEENKWYIVLEIIYVNVWFLN